MYDNLEYASSRLRYTIVRDSEGDPVIIDSLNRGDGGAISVRCKKLNLPNESYDEGRDDWVTNYCWVTLGELNLEPVPLGFCNTTSGLMYIARQPMRGDYRQGLRPNNSYDILSGNRYNSAYDGSLYKTIKGIFPKFKDCCDFSVNEGRSLAFSRCFAVKDDRIIYKWLGEVGRIVGEGFELDSRFEYLTDMLEEAIND